MRSKQHNHAELPIESPIRASQTMNINIQKDENEIFIIRNRETKKTVCGIELLHTRRAPLKGKCHGVFELFC